VQTKQSRHGLIGKGQPCRNYHSCVAKILESLRKFQGKDDIIREYIQIGDHASFRRLFFPVSFIIGDSQSQDKMCGRYLAYANVPRICRACDVTPEESENPNHKCKFIAMSDIHDMCLVAMQLYLPEQYRIGTDLDQFTLHKKSKKPSWKRMRI